MKYAGPSGIATRPSRPGLGANPRRAYAAWHSGAKNTWPITGSSAAASERLLRNRVPFIVAVCQARLGGHTQRAV